MTAQWCLTAPNGERTFHATEADATEAAVGGKGVVWFDSFDYELYDRAGSATWYAQRAARERALGLAYVAGLVDGLRARVGVAA